MAAATAGNNANGLSGDAAAASPMPIAPPGSSDANSNTTTTSNGNSAAKRKRDASNDGDEEMTDAGAPPTAAAAAAPGATVDQIKAAASTAASPALSAVSINGKSESARSSHKATPDPVTSTTAGNRDEKRLIRDYFAVLERWVRTFCI